MKHKDADFRPEVLNLRMTSVRMYHDGAVTDRKRNHCLLITYGEERGL